MAHLLAAPDKFRGTASADEVAGAIAGAAARVGHACARLPLSDGGDGLLEVVGGERRHNTVTGPLGEPTEAEWRLLPASRGQPATAVIEMAQASGLSLAGGIERNDPIAATTRGTGELVLWAIAAGARRIIVGLGGSATTDGGAGALEVLADAPERSGVELVAACDVTTRFLDAPSVFGPQKGADAATIPLLEERLDRLAGCYERRFGCDVRAIPGAGAAGGLAGGLAALGARLSSGFDLVAQLLGLEAAVAAADLVVTGEGRLDATSFSGKVVGGVLEACRAHPGVDALVVVGVATDEAIAACGAVPVLSLTAAFGERRARAETGALIAELVARYLGEHPPNDGHRAGG